MPDILQAYKKTRSSNKGEKLLHTIVFPFVFFLLFFSLQWLCSIIQKKNCVLFCLCALKSEELKYSTMYNTKLSSGVTTLDLFDSIKFSVFFKFWEQAIIMVFVNRWNPLRDIYKPLKSLPMQITSNVLYSNRLNICFSRFYSSEREKQNTTFHLCVVVYDFLSSGSNDIILYCF